MEVGGDEGNGGAVTKRPGERGAVDVVVVALLGGALVLGGIAGACLLLRGVGHGLALLDDERGALVCEAAPDRLPASGLPVVMAPANRLPESGPPGLATVTGGRRGLARETVPCLPRRLDYAAPGGPQRAAPEAFCALLRQAGLPAVVGARSCP